MTAAKVNDRKALDSLPMMPNTTYVVDRAYNDYAWHYSLHQQNSIFVGKMKANACYQVSENLVATGSDIISDEVIRMSAEKAQKGCPIPLRRVVFVRKED